LVSELFLIALLSSKCYSSTPTVHLCFHKDKLFDSRTFDNIAETSPEKIHIMQMNRLNRRAASGSCVTILLQYNYTRAYRNENVSKRFSFSSLTLWNYTMKMMLCSSLSLWINAHIKMKTTGPCCHFFKAHQQVQERQGGKKDSSAYCTVYH